MEQYETELFNSSEAAKYLKISLSQLYQLNAQKKIPCHYVGKKPTYIRQELFNWVKDGKLASN